MARFINKKGKLRFTIENGIGLIIGGVLLQFGMGILLTIVPIALILLGVVQIFRGHSEEGFTNIIISVAILILSRLVRGLAHYIGAALIVIGVVVLIIGIFSKK